MNPTIHTAFWSDPDIEAVDHQIKLAVLWLITNPQTSIIGLCKVSGRRFQFETGLDAEWLDRACEQLPRTLLRTLEGVWIRNFIHHQFGTGEKLLKNNCIRPIFSALTAIKDSALKQALAESYPEFMKLDGRGMESPLQAPSEGLPRGRAEKSRESQSPEGGQGGTSATHAAEIEGREVSANEIVAGVQRIFKTHRRPGVEAMHRVAEAMPVKASELDELERFYAAPAEPDNPAMARCLTPKNLCLQLGDQLVKARDFCVRNGRRLNGVNGHGKPPPPTPPTAEELSAWQETLPPESEWRGYRWQELPEAKQSEVRRWQRRNHQPIPA